MSQSHVNSWYAATANFAANFSALTGSERSDVCVVGGGYTGLSAAIHLRKRGYSVTLLEANRLAWGASGRNGGHVGTGQRADQEALEKLVGQHQARALWDLGLEGVATVCELIDEFAIQCELKQGNLHTACTKKAAKEFQEEVDHLRTAYDYEHVRYVAADELGAMTSAQGFHGAILDTASRHLHPLNYCLGLARAAQELGVVMHEDSRVSHYEENTGVTVHTDGGQVDCEHLLLACNGYLGKLEPRVAGQIMPINNYVVATEPLGEETARRLIRDDTSMSDSRFVINYWKLSADNRLLFGGGESYTSRFPSDIANFVRPYMLSIYPELADTRIDYGWGGTLAITLNRMPALGYVSPRILYAHGYSGHGVPIATLAGKLVAEAIAGTAERFDVMANVPTPKFPGGTLLRWPGLVAGMLFYSLRDRLG
ncbi:NAD(P)/FAD-dependent oxidoreductase [Congregibacter sp.]|uniref:NAD(P)/FAD-dependent oxidoreductase n=1 Tax=Congregibacter sp. TaxID=2744308 RepID=UPI00385D2922